MLAIKCLANGLPNTNEALIVVVPKGFRKNSIANIEDAKQSENRKKRIYLYQENREHNSYYCNRP